MPCDGSHLEPNRIESEAGRLDVPKAELGAGEHVDPVDYGNSFRYDATQAEATRKLCTRLRKVEDIGSRSLELQIWWLNHQKADRAKKRK